MRTLAVLAVLAVFYFIAQVLRHFFPDKEDLRAVLAFVVAPATVLCVACWERITAFMASRRKRKRDLQEGG